jgi:hypothetical protein
MGEKPGAKISPPEIKKEPTVGGKKNQKGGGKTRAQNKSKKAAGQILFDIDETKEKTASQ